MLKYLLLLLLFCSCTIIPQYRLRKTEYCEQRTEDTICKGYEERYAPHYNVCSIYDVSC